LQTKTPPLAQGRHLWLHFQLFSLDADDFTCVCDKLTWADCCALAAVYALIIIDMSEEAINMDSVVFTNLYAHRAADTADITHGAKLGALIVVAAAYEYVLIKGNDIDNTAWAGCNALAASLTLIGHYLCNTVNDFDSIVRADRLTSAETETAIRTFKRTALHLGSCDTVLDAVVFILLLGVCVAAGAHYMSDLLCFVSSFNAHDGSDFLCTFVTADRAGIYRCITFDNCISTSGAACETAAAAVCARESFFDERKSFIAFNCKELACECKKESKKCADTAERYNRKKNFFHFMTS